MNKEIAKKWIKALRSGKYQQGMYALRVYNSYCCLGVLCDIIDNSAWVKSDEQYKLLEYQNDVSTLPPSIQKVCGITTGPLVQYGKKDGTTLASRNDKGYSFAQIASIIERNWKKL